MNIVSFVEGARAEAGGVGLVGVPLICHAVARYSNHVVLNVFGQPMPSLTDLRTLSDNPLEVTVHRAWGRWAFAPASFRQVARQVREADFVTLHSLYSFPVLLGYLLARFYHKPYGLWPHGVLAPFQRQISSRKKKIYDGLLARRILDQATVLFYSASGERDETQPLKLHAPSVIVPHGIELPETDKLPAKGEFRAKFLNAHSGPVLLYLGRLHAKKGLELLLAAFEQVASRNATVKLVIAGGGDPPRYAEHIGQLVEQAGLEKRVVLTGKLDNAAKLAALVDADLFVLPSYAENFSFAMFEALAHRVPVIVSESLNLAGEVRRYRAGLTPPRDPAAFSTAILELLADEARRKQMGENGFELAKLYSWQSTGERVTATIRHILENLPLPSELTCEPTT
jgi:glycosyltransferase involved in cell wall biosynthesis